MRGYLGDTCRRKKEALEGPHSALGLLSAVDRRPPALTSAVGCVFSLLSHNPEHSTHQQLPISSATPCYPSNEQQPLVLREPVPRGSAHTHAQACPAAAPRTGEPGGLLSGKWAEPWRRKRNPPPGRSEAGTGETPRPLRAPGLERRAARTGGGGWGSSVRKRGRQTAATTRSPHPALGSARPAFLGPGGEMGLGEGGAEPRVPQLESQLAAPQRALFTGGCCLVAQSGLTFVTPWTVSRQAPLCL